ncbi:MAG: hypothetical protein RL154_77, partial [Pseudomonadota bacterium]
MSKTLQCILLFALFRLVVALSFDLGVDEAHYALYSRFIDLSYFDHPPLVGWTHYIFTTTFGNNNFALRISAIILSAILSFQTYILLQREEFSERAIFWSVLALNSSFMIGALSIALLPDSLLVVL